MITVKQTATAVGAGIQASFSANGGMAPYTFSVLPGGAGGAIGNSTGLYVAPLVLSDDPARSYDQIVVTDANGDTGTARILVGSALILFCDILQKELGLPNGRVYLWDQKIMQPHDSDLYIAVSESSCQSIGSTNTNVAVGGGLESLQTVVMSATIMVDFISKGPAARDRKEELIAALSSNYSKYQQDANSFNVAVLSVNAQFTNLSHVDGAAIPYRFQIPVKIKYLKTKSLGVEYFDKFDFEVETDPKYAPPEPPDTSCKYYDLIWEDQTTYVLDITAAFQNSRLTALVDIITMDGVDYPSEFWGFKRPSIETIQITSGAPFTGTIRVVLTAMVPA